MDQSDRPRNTLFRTLVPIMTNGSHSRKSPNAQGRLEKQEMENIKRKMKTEMDAENGNGNGIKLAHVHKNSHEVVTVVRP